MLISPGQSRTVFEYSPVNFAVESQAISAEKLPLIIHTVFTIGPAGDDQDSLLNNAKLLAPHRLQSDYVRELVQGIVEEVVKVLAALMSMEDVFKDIKAFKLQVVDGIQLELAQFGLRVYNSNIKVPVMLGNVNFNVFEDSVKEEIRYKERLGHTAHDVADTDAETERQRKKRRLMWDLVGYFEDEINIELARKQPQESKLAEVVAI